MTASVCNDVALELNWLGDRRQILHLILSEFKRIN